MVLMPRQVWVRLLVWRPADSARPFDISRGWPRVLHVVKDDVPGLPEVVLRPGEPLRLAAARVAAALGMRAAEDLPRMLALDQWPPQAGGDVDQMVLILDGGMSPTDTLPPCGECGYSHVAWASMDAVEPATSHALRALVGHSLPPILWRGEPGGAG
ncbi:hypothetical protein [Streptomyces buecherae]|uniref:hypothetical protein n=1 Tax=Streptomyces buecherae TaxID=2763006 RepID=UPI0036AA2743